MYRILGIYAFLATVTIVTSLQPYDKFREGSCSGVPVRPIKASREFVDKLKYISAGSKYHLYRMASAMPNYKSIREREFYYDFCYGRNTTSIDPIGASFGFGQLLSTFRITTKPGIYLEAIPLDPSQAWDTLRQTVTLTDNRSFAFIVNCWTGSNQRAWDLVTLSPNIDRNTQKVIEEHAASLGFKRENFIFLRYDSCRWGNPIFEKDEWRGLGQSGAALSPVRPSQLKRATTLQMRIPEPEGNRQNIVRNGWTA